MLNTTGPPQCYGCYWMFTKKGRALAEKGSSQRFPIGPETVARNWAAEKDPAVACSVN